MINATAIYTFSFPKPFYINNHLILISNVFTLPLEVQKMANEKIARLSGNPHVRNIHDERFDHCVQQTTNAGQELMEGVRKEPFKTAHGRQV